MFRILFADNPETQTINRKEINMDGRSSVCENEAPLISVIVEEVILAQPGKIFTVREIYRELINRGLYNFSPDAKTPMNSIATRLSCGVLKGFPRLKKTERGKYSAA